MKITSHKGKGVTIDGGGGIYLVHHKVTGHGCCIIEEPQSESRIAFTRWVIYTQPNVSRLKRFFKLMCIVWKFTK